jgi:hypothetical protein
MGPPPRPPPRKLPRSALWFKNPVNRTGAPALRACCSHCSRSGPSPTMRPMVDGLSSGTSADGVHEIHGPLDGDEFAGEQEHGCVGGIAPLAANSSSFWAQEIHCLLEPAVVYTMWNCENMVRFSTIVLEIIARPGPGCEASVQARNEAAIQGPFHRLPERSWTPQMGIAADQHRNAVRPTGKNGPPRTLKCQPFTTTRGKPGWRSCGSVPDCPGPRTNWWKDGRRDSSGSGTDSLRATAHPSGI